MRKLQDYVIGDLLRKTDDPFERARAVLLFRFTIVFTVVFAIPIAGDVIFQNYKAFTIHVFAAFTLLISPFIYRAQKDLRKSLLTFFTFSVVIETLITMCLNPEVQTTVSVTWCSLFIALSVLMLRKTDRIVYSCFILWIPIIYPYINQALHGVLTFDFITETNVGEAPAFIVLLPLVLMMYAFYTNTTTITQAQLLIEQQKADIELKKREITDSIIYSQRIQNAIIPKEEEVRAALPNCFVFYKPKDVVSGDFYFLEEKSNSVFLAAADCTGHGVPGAFMSLIGSKELSIAYAQSEEPSDILFKLNNQLKSTLKQNRIDSTRDGMDIAFVRINGKRIAFAGANRPLWLIRTGSQELTEIKGTKACIGGDTKNDQQFEQHILNLEKGDCMYLFSDGFADQFGGEKQKKLTTKRFKQLLLSLHHLPVDQQKNELERFFTQWKGDSEQIDDVLVIGIVGNNS